MAGQQTPSRHALSWLTDANYFNMPLWFPLHFLVTQFKSLPYPTTDYTGQTIIVTGANVGLGLEAARHFCRLGAAKVILACRDPDKGHAARADIEASLASPLSRRRSDGGSGGGGGGGGGGVMEVWQLDMSSFQSVQDFAQRAASELDRLDVVVENAGVATGAYVEADGGFESTIAINVVSTFLLLLLLLPTLRRTAAQCNVEPRAVIVSSDAHLFAKFNERHQPGNIFDWYKSPHNMNEDRYNVSKLLEVFVVRELAARLAPAHLHDDPVVILNALNPGFCRTDLFRHAPFPLNYIVGGGLRLLGRSSEVGARTLLSAAAGDRHTHGQYMDSCVLRAPSALVVSAEGQALQRRVYAELMDVLEGIQPGVTKNVSIAPSL